MKIGLTSQEIRLLEVLRGAPGKDYTAKEVALEFYGDTTEGQIRYVRRALNKAAGSNYLIKTDGKPNKYRSEIGVTREPVNLDAYAGGKLEICVDCKKPILDGSTILWKGVDRLCLDCTRARKFNEKTRDPVNPDAYANGTNGTEKQGNNIHDISCVEAQKNSSGSSDTSLGKPTADRDTQAQGEVPSKEEKPVHPAPKIERDPGSALKDAIIRVLESEDNSVGILKFNDLIRKLGLELDKVLYILGGDPHFIITPLSISYRKDPPHDGVSGDLPGVDLGRHSGGV